MHGLTPQMERELAELRERYDNGALDAQTVSDLMESAIDAELLKPEQEVNNAWLDACAELMTYVDREALASFPDQTEETWQNIHEGLKQRNKSHGTSRIKFILRIAACCLLLMLGMGISFRFSWFNETSSSDEQQHIIQGHEIRINSIRNALAANPEVTVFEVESHDELLEQLGFDPIVPATIHDHWTADLYTIIYLSDSLRIITNYTDAANSAVGMAYIQFCFTDLEEAYLSFEQSMEGTHIEVGGNSVYFSMNENRSLFIWIVNETVYCLAGDFDQNEGIEILEELWRMEDEAYN